MNMIDLKFYNPWWTSPLIEFRPLNSNSYYNSSLNQLQNSALSRSAVLKIGVMLCRNT